ncbi:MAG: SUMF1/EgtB/PvdO family nonheme iron enzyme [Planctomycetes bacterium]|nr:SUMF1/EgtB/PvdO family nonheme iron enzyme [Planctomycetota bacterium]
MDERSEILLPILDGIVDLPPVAQAPALEAACRSHPDLADDLRRQFARYLDLAEGGGGNEDSTAGEWVGPYRLVEVLGEGGMGIVYRAEQREPVRRQVALKLLKYGFPGQRALARFQVEQQALAMMEHEGIAKLYECGATADGRPYVAMELVAGEPLTAYCECRLLTVPERLGLLLQVCDAVQHAHHKGVVHRDLKPTNVLVTDEGGQPRVKVIDFGLAKPTAGDAFGDSMHTEFGAALGTPEYMAPEQFDDARDVDTRADVYALGVLLHELLVGALPFPRERCGEGRGGREPTAPSRRLATAAAAAEVARRRKTTRLLLARALRQDLDWVVLKALAPEREQRYPTPAALAAELRRYLAGEPLETGPPRLGYRLRKTLRRHRLALGVVTLVLATAVTGAGVSWHLLLRAREQEGVARTRAEANAALARHNADLAASERAARGELDVVVRDFELLAAVVRHRQVLANERLLHPPWPERAPAMARWLDEEAAPLLAMRPAIAAAIARLRPVVGRAPAVRGLLDPDAEVELPPPKTWFQALWLARSPDDFRLAFDIAIGAQPPSAASAPLATSTATGDALAFLYDELADLEVRLAELADVVCPRVQQRLGWARRIESLSPGFPGARHSWAEVQAAIATGTGIELRDEDVVGLVPIGQNPATGLWEFYDLRSAWDGKRDLAQISLPRHGTDGSLRLRPGSGIVFVLLPGGTFTMGGQRRDEHEPNFDPYAAEAETPHAVTLAPFLIARHELTRGQWLRLGGEKVFGFRDGERRRGEPRIGDRHPAESVTWLAASELLRQHGLVLPTEAQWEYACRAGTSTPWWTGADPGSLAGAANVQDVAAVRNNPDWGRPEDFDDGVSVLAVVGSYRANAFGLYDMHGNVAEWCRDRYGYYEGPVRAGDGLRLIDDWLGGRVVRGGSFSSRAVSCRSARRVHQMPDQCDHAVGVRAVRALRSAAGR